MWSYFTEERPDLLVARLFWLVMFSGFAWMIFLGVAVTTGRGWEFFWGGIAIWLLANLALYITGIVSIRSKPRP